ncbi:MAG: ABC transporter permease [Gemmatimonadaceae bacterium]
MVTLATRVRSIGDDLWYGLRRLRRSPAFAVSAVLTLALGMCALITTYGVVDSVLLRPLPYPGSARVVSIVERGAQTRQDAGPSAPLLRSWRARSVTLSDIAGYSARQVTATGLGEPQRFYLAQVTEGFFRILGSPTRLGRTLVESDHGTNAPAVVVLSYDTWQHAFGGDPAVLGKQLTLDGLTTQVVGVMPASFVFPDQKISGWISLGASAAYLLDRSDIRLDGAIGRLRPNVSSGSVQVELRDIERQVSDVTTATDDATDGRRAAVTSLRDHIAGQVRSPLLLLLSTGALVMIIACANVANLLVARASAREREIAVRIALGASNARLVQQMLIESFVIATVAAGLGLILANSLSRIIRQLGSSQLPRSIEIGIHPGAVLFTAGVVIVIAAIFGLAPSLDAARSESLQALRVGTHQIGSNPTRVRWREIVAVSELTFTMMLLAGAGLLAKSVAQLLGSPLGFSSAHVLVATIARPLGEWPANKDPTRRFGDELVAQVSGIPGVRATAVALVPPGSHAITGVVRSGGIAGHSGDSLVVDEQVVTPEYFRTLGIPLLRGRSFDERDGAHGTPTVMIDDAAARSLYPGRNPVGQLLRAPGDDATGPPPEVSYLILGLVGNIREPGPAIGPPRPHVYIPFDRYPVPHMTLLVLASGSAATIAPSVRRVVSTMDAAQPVASIGSLDDLLAEAAARPQFYLLFLGVAAVIALAIALVGVYAVIAFGVQQRTREIGVRTALGAGRPDVLRLVLGRALLIVSAGLTVGLIGAWATTRTLAGLLVGVAPTDPWVFGGVALLLAASALIASLIPALRALRVSPLVALRAE